MAMVQASDSIPVWAFVLVIIIILVLMAALTFWLVRRRRLSRSPTVDIENTGETKLTTVEPIEARTHTVKKSAAAGPPTPPESQVKVDKDPSVYEEPVREEPKREAKQQQDWKIALPLPPPSTSLFSDKMELSSDEAMELFDRYMNAGMENRGDHDRLSFAANMQQKAATIRSTMRRSLRRKKSAKAAPLDQLFDQSSSTPPRSPSVRRKSSAQASACSSPSVTSSRVDQPPASLAEDTPEPKRQQEPPVNAMHAAQRVIRSASRKSKTRSMLVNEEDVHRLFSQQEKEAANERNAMTITSGSVRRLVRDSLVNDGLDKTPKTPATALEVSQWFPDGNKQQQPTTNHTSPTALPPPRKPAKLTEEEDAPQMETFFETHGGSTESMASEKYQMGPKGGEVDTIRRMLQATWKANMKESESMASITSTAAPPSSSNPRQQNQFLLAQSLNSTHGIRKSSEDVVLVQPPAPTVSFSSSTVRTVVPEEPREQQQKPVAASIVAQEKIEVDGTNFAMMAPPGHQTWNGRNVKKVVQQLEQQSGEHVADKSSFFNTVHVGRRQSKRRVMPWMDHSNADYKATPAQQERDQYLRSLYRNVNNA